MLTFGKEKAPRNKGFTLIELAVAVLVLALGAIATTRAGDQAQEALSGIQARTLARIVAQNRAEELNLFGASATLPQIVGMGGQRFTVDVAREATLGGLTQATIRVRSQQGASVQLVAYVPQFGAQQ